MKVKRNRKQLQRQALTLRAIIVVVVAALCIGCFLYLNSVNQWTNPGIRRTYYSVVAIGSLIVWHGDVHTEEQGIPGEQWDDFVPHGYYRRWSEDGQLIEEMYFDNGVPVGIYRGWSSETGLLWIECVFDEDPEAREWNTRGPPVMCGEWRHFEKGIVCRISRHRKGKLHGPYREFHENGASSISGQYAEGRKIGAWVWYDKNGAVLREERFD